MGTRSIWNGSISFGLVNIPVKLFSASDSSNEYSFNQLDEKGHRIQYKKWCPVEEREVQYSEIRKGYEISKEKYIIIEKEDLDKIKAKTTKTIDIKEFVDKDDLDPILVERSYYVSPYTDSAGKKRGKSKKEHVTSASTKAFVLFVNALRDTGKIAIGKVVLKDRESLVAIRPYQKGLVMHQLMFQEDITPIDEIEGMPGSSSHSASEPNASPALIVDPRELELGRTLIENLSNEQFDASQYSDEYSKQLEKLITAKSQGAVYKVEEKEEEADSGSSLLEALRASVQRSRAATATATATAKT
jgi:DNA end-binding protein Ku